MDRARRPQQHAACGRRARRATAICARKDYVVYPEGRARLTSCGDFKKGAFMMAIDAGVPSFPFLSQAAHDYSQGEVKIIHYPTHCPQPYPRAVFKSIRGGDGDRADEIIQVKSEEKQPTT